MTEISCRINTPSKPYDVIINYDWWDKLISLIRQNHPISKLALITEDHLFKLFQDRLSSLENVHIFSIPAGEASKSAEEKARIESFLFEQKFNRQDALIALGGGVIGDLVGFVAATYMRAIPFYQVPTSVISMVDSSVGGKTGINNQYGKNLVGAFYQPEAVLIDLKLLETLPQDEYLNGLAEVAKYGFIYEKKIHTLFQEKLPAILDRDTEILQELVRLSVECKNHVVSNDEREGGLRRILNFGHTVGHAVEFLTKFKIKHGFSISIGMALEAFISKEKGLLDQKSFLQIVELLGKIKLPTTIPGDLSNERIFETMLLDKKNNQQKVSINLLESIGSVHANNGAYVVEMEKSEIMEILEKYRG